MVRGSKSKDKASSSYNVPRRDSDEVEEFKDYLIRKVEVEQERGINMVALREQQLQSTVEFMGWEKLINPEGDYNLTWVALFHAAAHPDDIKDGKAVTVRGKKVKFTPKAINHHFGTESFKNNRNYHHGFPFPNSPAENLTAEFVEDIRPYPRCDWVQGETSIDHRELTCKLAFWNLFIRHNVLPVQSNQKISALNTKVLKCIKNEHKFDLGEVICAYMREQLLEQRFPRMILPHLITALCGKAGVPVDNSDIIRQPRKKISTWDWDQIVRFRDPRAYAAEGIPMPGPSRRAAKRLREAQGDTAAAAEEQGEHSDQHMDDVPEQQGQQEQFQPQPNPYQPGFFGEAQYNNIMGCFTTMRAEQTSFYEATERRFQEFQDEQQAFYQRQDSRLDKIENQVSDGFRSYQDSLDLLRAQMESWTTFQQVPHQPPSQPSAPGESSGKGKAHLHPSDSDEE